MKYKLDNYIGNNGIIEVQNRERSACKLVSVETSDPSFILTFESIFPVRELNFDDTPNWKTDLSTTAFGKNFTFMTDELTEKPENNQIRFIEKERNLTVTVDFTESIVKEIMLKYIDELIPKI